MPRNKAKKQFSRINKDLLPSKLRKVSYIKFSSMRLNNCLFVSRPINESRNNMVSDNLSGFTAYVKEMSAYRRTPILSPESKSSSDPRGTTIFRLLVSPSSGQTG